MFVFRKGQKYFLYSWLTKQGSKQQSRITKGLVKNKNIAFILKDYL